MAIQTRVVNPAFGDDVGFDNAYIVIREITIRLDTHVESFNRTVEQDEEGNVLRTEPAPKYDANGNVIYTSSRTIVGHAFAYADRNARALGKAPVASINFQFPMPEEPCNMIAWVYGKMKTDAGFRDVIDV